MIIELKHIRDAYMIHDICTYMCIIYVHHIRAIIYVQSYACNHIRVIIYVQSYVHVVSVVKRHDNVTQQRSDGSLCYLVATFGRVAETALAQLIHPCFTLHLAGPKRHSLHVHIVWAYCMYIWYEHIICKLTFLTSVGATNPAWNAAAPIPYWYLSPLRKAGGSPPTLKVLFQCGTKAFTMVKVYRFRVFSISTVHIICPYRMCISYVHFICPCVMPCACVKRIPYVHIRCVYMIVCTYEKWIKRVF